LPLTDMGHHISECSSRPNLEGMRQQLTNKIEGSERDGGLKLVLETKLRSRNRWGITRETSFHIPC
jgi:hypothetical protein